MRVHLLEIYIVHADETTLQVLRESGKAASSDSYLWLYRTGRAHAPIVFYEKAFRDKGDKNYFFMSHMEAVNCLINVKKIRRYEL